MFSPKELEGEVDHSFFDSDSEVGRTVDQDPEKKEGSKPIHAETSHTERNTREEMDIKEREKDKTLEEVFSSLEVQNVEKEKSGDHSGSTSEEKEVSENNVVKDSTEAESGREDSDASSTRSSPLPCSDRTPRRSSQSDDASDYSSVEPRSDSSNEERGDDAVFKNDNDETESDNNKQDKRPELLPLKHYSDTSKRFAGKFRSRSRSSSSEREDSIRGDEKSPAPSRKPSQTSSSSSPRRRPRLGSANQRQRSRVSETVESEDTVTDVTPLSTPDVSPGQSFDLTPPTEPSESDAGQQQQDVIKEPSVTEVDAGKRRSSDTDEQQSVLSGGRRVDSVLVISSPSSVSSRSLSSQHRRNFSFTNDEVRRIERENQRLLRELSRTSPRSRNRAFTRYSAPPTAPPTARLYHSALNRQREQHRIQRENLAFLKRLESVKPTPGMTRAEQLSDYQRQAGYLGVPASLSRPSSGKSSRPCSTNTAHRSRPDTAKPSRTTAPRPAWS